MKKGRLLKIALLLAGFSGMILFFPLPLPGQTTCLAHCLISSPKASQETAPGTPLLYRHHEHHPEATGTSEEHHHLLMKRYLFPYGLLWWASLGILGWQLRGLRIYRHSIPAHPHITEEVKGL